MITFRCLLLGCVWGGAYTWYSLKISAPLTTHTCQRCGAQKTESAA